MNKNKQTLKTIFSKAVENYRKRDFETAEISCHKIISIDPYHFDSLALLANISAINKNYDKAKNFLLKANEIQPNNVSILNNLGTAYKELGKHKEAIKFYEKTIEIDSNHTNAHYNLGVVFYSLKEIKKAKQYFQKTVEMQKNYALAFFSLANVHTDLKELENAVSCYQKAIDINPNLLGAHNNLGLVFRALNDFENAINCYEKILKIKPDYVGAHHNLAMAYKELGNFKKAIKSHEAAIKYEPNNSIHYYYLSELQKDILDSNLKSKVEKIIENKNSSKSNTAYGNFLLSKYENKKKNYENELKYLIQGHKDYFESKKEKFELGVKYCFDDVMQVVNGANVESEHKKEDYDVKPIFIIGVPRSGSTLVEKIIVSGKKNIPTGEETQVFENFVNEKIIERQSLNLGKVFDIRNDLFNIYKNRGLISKKYNYSFTDKSLNNFFYLNLIKEIYPQAKIINCKRDIISSIMSIFQNNLTELAWTHNLENIFKYFDNYFKIIEKFKDQNPNFIYELEFEKLTNLPIDESKKLMKFCNLPWDEKCLEFYKRKDLVSKTASNVQIREAVYKHSLEKYLPYKKFIKSFGKKYSWFN